MVCLRPHRWRIWCPQASITGLSASSRKWTSKLERIRICATIQTMQKGSEWRWVVVATLVLVLASSLPYAMVWITTMRAGTHFTGLLFNPQDGNSYIAKMRQGLNGSWLFRLPYTPESQEGAPVYLFYLFLGHVARWTSLPLIMVYHAARVLGGAAMLAMIYVLATCVTEEVHERRAMFLFVALGSGLGWLVVFFGYRSADLWVPEAFPVYALLANAHFPLSMALMAGIVYCALRIVAGGAGTWLWATLAALAGIVLGGVQPFGLVAVFGGLGVMLVAHVVRERAIPWRAAAGIAAAALVSLPYPLYMPQAIASEPVLAVWNAQNVTDSPPLWDWVLSYGLVAVLAVPGVIAAARRGSAVDWVLLGWVGVTLVGMYLPLPLQRRLSLGLGVPLGLLAGAGWWRAVRLRVNPRRRGFVQGLVVAFCVLTPMFLIAGHLATASDYTLSDGEWAALQWLREDGHPDAVVLCTPRMGLFVPAWAGQSVVYGHPFETVYAEERRAQVEAFWAGEMDADEREAFLQENDVAYVLAVSEIERLESGDWRLVIEVEDVKLYDIRSE
jgi:hypothetical protein